jgi:hypothetical protein
MQTVDGTERQLPWEVNSIRPKQNGSARAVNDNPQALRNHNTQPKLLTEKAQAPWDAVYE